MDEAAPPKGRRFQYRLRTLLLMQAGLAVVLCIVSGIVWWWGRLPPSSWRSWGNVAYMPSVNSITKVASSTGTSVPQFLFGGFSSNHRPTEIGYLVRIDDLRQLSAPMSWLSRDRGRIFINGRLVLPKGEGLLLLVADGDQNPKCVVLDIQDSATFRGFKSRGVGYPVGYEHIPRFWNDVLRKKYLPELTEQR